MEKEENSKEFWLGDFWLNFFSGDLFMNFIIDSFVFFFLGNKMEIKNFIY